MRIKLGAVAGSVALFVAVASSGYAASQAETELKADIDRVIEKLETGTDAILKWDGADSIVIRPQGDGAVAEIGNARIVIGAKDSEPVRVTLDRVEIRRAPGPDNSIKLGLAFPNEAVIRGAKGEETRLKLKEATANLVIDAQSGRARETEMSAAGGRLDDKKSGDWLSFGPLSLSSKLVGAGTGGWSGPLSFELKGIEFFFTEGPVAGLIERIGYGADATGPDFAALNRVRDRIDALQQQKDTPQDKRLDVLFDLLPELPSLFTMAKGELVIERFVVRAATGEPLVAFDTASFGGGLTGLSGDAAAMRMTLKHDGLTVAPMLLDKEKVPQRIVIDFGVEEVETAALRTIAEAARKLREDDKKSAAQQQMLGAVSRLNPVFRIYSLVLDTPDIGVDGTAEVKGSPLAPKGYTASGDLAVRGLDALPDLARAAPFAEFLPLLSEIGTTAPGGDGTPRVKFQLASAPPKWLTVNGNDVSPWFMDGGPGAARVLRPDKPVMTGNDVRDVQRALAAASIQAPQNGRYDGPTAVAVARFQKRNGLSVNGAVDAATRQKLAIKRDNDQRVNPVPKQPDQPVSPVPRPGR